MLSRLLSEICIFVIIECLHLVDFGDWRKDFPRLNTNTNCMLVNKFYHNFNTVLNGNICSCKGKPQKPPFSLEMKIRRRRSISS